jgi:hypothetical protein
VALGVGVAFPGDAVQPAIALPTAPAVTAPAATAPAVPAADPRNARLVGSPPTPDTGIAP